MKFKKSYIIDILVLIIPVIIMILLIPILPDKVPTHWDINGNMTSYIDKNYSFVLGILPFVVYESIKFKYSRKRR